MFHLLIECTEPCFELVLIVVPGEPERLQLIGEESDFIVLVLEHVDVALVFFLEFGYFFVFVFDLSFEELDFLLENGALLFHFHFGHFQVHLLLLKFLLEFAR
jgi:hypothetical protein